MNDLLYSSLPMPEETKAAIASLRDELLTAAQSNITSLILYGGVARGRYYPNRSDINLLVVLRDGSLSSLDAIAPILHSAWRSHRVESLLLVENEIQRAANIFPTKFLDIQQRHILLHGENPFKVINVSDEHIRLRVEQELRNLLMRLRRRYVAISQSPPEQALFLREIARPFALNLSVILSLSKLEVPSDNRTESIFNVAADAFGLKKEALAQLAMLRQSENSATDATQLLRDTLISLEAIIERVEAMRQQ